MENRANALANIEKEVESTIGAMVKFTATKTSNGYTTYETQDLSKLTGILGGTLIKRAYLSACAKDKPLDDGAYWWKVNWRFEFDYGSNGNEYATIWTNADGDVVVEQQERGITTTETRKLYRDNLRRLCIERKWYTLGCNEEYSQILDYADNATNVTTADIVHIAEDIKIHSDTEQDIPSICFDIAEICHSFFAEVDI